MATISNSAATVVTGLEDINTRKSPSGLLVHWFRRGLRLHDNPAFRDGLLEAATFRCIYILDPYYAGVGVNKWRFLLQSLKDLDTSLRKWNSRLFVIRGQPADVFPKLIEEWRFNTLSFEEEPEPYGRERDKKIRALIESHGIKGNPDFHSEKECYTVPSLEDLGFDQEDIQSNNPCWLGGETEALARLQRYIDRKTYVARCDRPKFCWQNLLPQSTGLSPYLRFGCLSPRLLYFKLEEVYIKIKKCQPPLSLFGQLLWREFFYFLAYNNSNFDSMKGNPICVQIPWDRNAKSLAKWANGHTGCPLIDAVMSQLKTEGWIHHLCKHATVCFLTRGDLFLSWEDGAKGCLGRKGWKIIITGFRQLARNHNLLTYSLSDYIDTSSTLNTLHRVPEPDAAKNRICSYRARRVRQFTLSVNRNKTPL